MTSPNSLYHEKKKAVTRYITLRLTGPDYQVEYEAVLLENTRPSFYDVNLAVMDDWKVEDPESKARGREIDVLAGAVRLVARQRGVPDAVVLNEVVASLNDDEEEEE